MRVICRPGWKPVAWRSPKRYDYYLDFDFYGNEIVALMKMDTWVRRYIIVEPYYVQPEEPYLGQEGFFGPHFREFGKLRGYYPGGLYPYLCEGTWYDQFVVRSEQTEFNLEIETPKGYRATEFRMAVDGEIYMSTDMDDQPTVLRGPSGTQKPILEKVLFLGEGDFGKTALFSDTGTSWVRSVLHGARLQSDNVNQYLDSTGLWWNHCKLEEPCQT